MGHILNVIAEKKEIKGFDARGRKKDNTILNVLVSARFLYFVNVLHIHESKFIDP